MVENSSKCINFRIADKLEAEADLREAEANQPSEIDDGDEGEGGGPWLSDDENTQIIEQAQTIRAIAEKIRVSAERIHNIAIVAEDAATDREEAIIEFSQLVIELIVSNQEGSIDREGIRRRILLFSKIFTDLLEISLEQGEISGDIRSRMVANISIVLRDILIN